MENPEELLFSLINKDILGIFNSCEFASKERNKAELPELKLPEIQYVLFLLHTYKQDLKDFAEHGDLGRVVQKCIGIIRSSTLNLLMKMKGVMWTNEKKTEAIDVLHLYENIYTQHLRLGKKMEIQKRIANNLIPMLEIYFEQVPSEQEEEE